MFVVGSYIEAKYIWPLVGVFLGWLLTALAATWVARREQKKAIGRLLAKLLIVSAQLDTVVWATETFKKKSGSWDGDGWKSYEKRRARLTKKHFLEGAVTIEKLQGLIGEVSGLFPTRAVSFDKLIENLTKAKTTSLETLDNVEVYVRLLSAHEMIITLAAQRLKREINSLAFKHSFLTFAKVLLINRRAARGRKRNADFVEEFIDDVRSKYG